MTSYIIVLFKKHKKFLPKKIQGSILDELIRYGFMTMISAWVFQSMLYMNWRETTLKIFIDAIITGLFIFMGLPWYLAFFIAHSLNFLLNYQIKATYNHMGAGNKSVEEFYRETLELKKRVDKADCLQASVAYGSLSRGCYKPTSDIDVRFIPAPGEWNFWKSCLFAIKERAYCNMIGYPLDMYVFTKKQTHDKMSLKELPIMMKEENGCMQDVYPERVEWEEWCKLFKKEHDVKI